MIARNLHERESSSSTLAVVGGGLAGMAAAWAAAERGLRVELFERTKTLGGRAGSFLDPKIGRRVDFCRHVAMGCCTEFIEFCRAAGINDCFQRTRTLHFIGPDGRRRDFTPTGLLPAPLHLLPGAMKLDYLSPAERWSIARALRKLVNKKKEFEEEETIGRWLRRQGQSQRMIDRFWSVLLIGALAETVDRASLSAARKVLRDGLLASRGASDLLLPRRPLVEIFNDRLGKRLAERGVKVHLDAAVRRIEGNRQSAEAIVLTDGRRREFDRFVVAVPWHKVRALFSDELLDATPALANVEKISPAEITVVHLWFDRPAVRLRHAVLVDRLSQWVFAEKLGDSAAAEHCQAVISASHRLQRRSREELPDAVRDELMSVWPAAGEARLLHRRVVVRPASVFSCQPGMDNLRPPQRTAIGNLALAGDWTATGWPGTMESAVRSGRRAVDALMDSH